MPSSKHHIQRSLPLYIEIYRVSDNRRTVNMSTTPHIFYQSGTENACKNTYADLSSWYEFCFAIICINMNVILDLFIAIQRF